MVRSRRAWARLGVVLLLVAVLPGPAKVPVAMSFGVALLLPALLDGQAQTSRCKQGVIASDPGPIRFEGLRWDPGPPRKRWRQVRIVVDGAELRSVSYWRRRSEPKVIALKGARLVSVTVSGPNDWNLKRGRMRILDYELGNGAGFRLAIDPSLVDEVTEAIGRSA